MPATYLAIDIGASSGRAVLGSFDGRTLNLREVHRFANGPIELPTGLHWDAPGLFDHVKRALSGARATGPLAGVGIDTWGVDYGLLSASGELLAPPYHYRDPRTNSLMDAAFKLVTRDHIYARTGIQFMPLNTLYQLLADQRHTTRPLDRAKALLFMPDLLHYWLTGIPRSERSIASTSQLYNTGANTWATDLIDGLGLPAHLFPAVAAPGTPLGPLLPAIAKETGAGPITVIPPASHDTGSAVAAIPAPSIAGDWAYISSGTWSLVGRELLTPLRTPQALAANFTNECGIAGTIRFHKNIAGLWLVQECRRVWFEQGRDYKFAQLADLAAVAPPLSSLIDPDHPAFAEFGDMPHRIRAFCAKASQPTPASDGALIRCIIESLALKSRIVIDALEALTGPIRSIHIVGGGANSPLLCQCTANAAQRPVLAGPVEATAAGNIMCQALARGDVANLGEIRSVIAASLPPTLYQPVESPCWTAALARFKALPAI